MLAAPDRGHNNGEAQSQLSSSSAVSPAREQHRGPAEGAAAHTHELYINIDLWREAMAIKQPTFTQYCT